MLESILYSMSNLLDLLGIIGDIRSKFLFIFISFSSYSTSMNRILWKQSSTLLHVDIIPFQYKDFLTVTLDKSDKRRINWQTD